MEIENMMGEGNSIKAYNGLPMPRRVFAVMTVTLAVVLAVMDLTIMNIALPSMSVQMHMAESDTIWILNAYQLTIIMSLLGMSSIGEIYSYKKVYICGISLFTLASLMCAFSQNFTMLVLSRALQGIGAAATMSINTTLLRLSYPKEWFGKGIGLNATFVAIASVIGPSLAALILTRLSWHWLFLINLPLGLFAITVGLKALPSNIVKLDERKFPAREMVMNALFFGSMMLMVEGISHQFPWWVISMFALVFVIDGYIYIHKELKMEYPLFPIDLLKIKLFRLSVVTSIASFTAQMLALVSLPFYLENTLGLSETETGLLFSVWPVSIMFTAPIAGALIGKVHAGLLGGIGLTLLAIGVGSLALYVPSSCGVEQTNFIWRLALCGIGFGLFQSPNNNVLVSTPPPSRSGSASGMLAMARLTGQTTGATLVALSFHLFAADAPKVALYAGMLVAISAAMISFSRLKLKTMKNFQKTILLLLMMFVLCPMQGYATSRISYVLSYNTKAKAIHVEMQYHPEGALSETFVYGNPKFGGQEDIFDCFRNLKVEGATCSVDSINRTVTLSRQTASSITLSYDVIDDGAMGQFQRELFRPVLKRDFFTCPTNCLFLLPQNLYLEVDVTWKKAPFPIYCYFQPKLKSDEIYHCHAYDFATSLIVGGKHLQHEYCKVGNADTYLITRLSKKEKFNYPLIKDHFTRYFDYLRTFWKDTTWEEYTVSELPFLDNSITHDAGGINFWKGFGSKYNTHSGDTVFSEPRLYNMSHEIGHHWLGGALALGHQQQWFDEGFDEYLTCYSLYHSGIKDRTWFIDSFNKLFDTYYNSPVSNTPNDSIWAHYWQMGDYNKLPYRRGNIFAFYLDNLISKSSDGRYDFHDFMLLLKKHVSENNNHMTISLFKSTLSEFLPKENVEMYMNRYIEQGNLIEFRDDQMSNDFHVRYNNHVPQIY